MLDPQSPVTKPIGREKMQDFAMARCFIPYGSQDRNKNRCGCKVCAAVCEKGEARRVTYPKAAGFWATAHVCEECFELVNGARERVGEGRI